jgi:hypothetical protein
MRIMSFRRIPGAVSLLCLSLVIPTQVLAAIVTSGDFSLQPDHDWVRVAAANAGETGTLEVNGGSDLISQGSVPIPLPGPNELEPGGMVGRFAGSFGTATVTGIGSTWLLQGIGTDDPDVVGDPLVTFGPFLLVGREGGRGELNVTGGGKVILDGLGADLDANGAANVKIGRDLSSEGGGSILNINGPGSEVIIDNMDNTQFLMGNGEASFVNITNQGNLSVAGENSITQIQWGEFNVNTGGTATTNLAVVGNRQNSNATVNIDGSTSSIHLTGVGTSDNNYGNDGFGGFMTIGRGEDSTAVVNLTNGANLIIDSGTTGTPTNGSGFSLGGNSNNSSGQGTLNVESGSRVTVSGGGEFVGIGRNQDGTGIINVNTGGEVIIENNDGTGAVPMSSGVFMAATADAGTAELNVDGITSKFDAGRSLNIGVDGGLANTANATVTVTNGGVVKADNIIVGSGGTIAGIGTVMGNTVINGGTIAPGLSPGTLTFDGDFTMNDGVLEIEIAGTSAGQFDILNVINGSASILGGTILFSFLDDFLPKTIDPLLEFLTAENGVTIDRANVGFAFSGVDESFELAVLNGSMNLEFQALNDAQPLPGAVPVPAAIWLFLSAMGLLGFLQKRNGVSNSGQDEPLTV